MPPKKSCAPAGDRGAGDSDWLAGTIKSVVTPSRHHFNRPSQTSLASPTVVGEAAGRASS